jgi:hypothetical protein
MAEPCNIDDGLIRIRAALGVSDGGAARTSIPKMMAVRARTREPAR